MYACVHARVRMCASVRTVCFARAKLPVAPRIDRAASGNACTGARMTSLTTQCAAHSTKREAAHLTSGKGLLIAMLQSRRQNLSSAAAARESLFVFSIPPAVFGKGDTNLAAGGSSRGDGATPRSCQTAHTLSPKTQACIGMVRDTDDHGAPFQRPEHVVDAVLGH